MKKRPNILFLMTDEQRYDAVGYVNPQVLTPHLDAMARESVCFLNAYTANPSCIPARAAIFTGRTGQRRERRLYFRENPPP